MLEGYYGEQRLLTFENAFIKEGYTVAGPKENHGKMKGHFDLALENDMFEQKTFEKAERKMFEHCIDGVISKSNLDSRDVDVILGGDLLNQNVSASFAARKFHCGYLGLYNACATFVEGLMLGASLVKCGLKNVLCVAGSHFSTAERQYRYPLELGVLRSPMTQWTATGVGATVISSEETCRPKIVRGFSGRVVDYGIMDVNNMGAAMAPAAKDTLCTFFRLTNSLPQDYDLILTGDLGHLGKEILADLMKREHFDLSDNFADCGASLFYEEQKTYQGGSGPACSALVFNSVILNGLSTGKIKKMLFVGTGALMSPTTCFQGDSIPAVAHLVEIGGCNADDVC